MLFKPSEKGQSLTEYAIILVFVAVVVIIIGCVCTSALWLPIVGVFMAVYWPQIVAGGTWLISGIKEGDSTAIFIASLIVVFVLFLIFRRRR